MPKPYHTPKGERETRAAILAMDEQIQDELDACASPCATHCPPSVPQCHLSDCTDDAAYEGWARKVDPFTGTTTGMMLFIPVCVAHKRVLIGAQGGAS